MSPSKLLGDEGANERAGGRAVVSAQSLATSIQSPASATLSRSLSSSGPPSHADVLTLQRALGNRRVCRFLQRAEIKDTSGEASLPAGAAPDIEFHFDPLPEDLLTGSVDQNAEQTVHTAPADTRAIPLQTQSGTSAAVTAQTLTWDDFPPVKQRIGGMSARTGLSATWKNDGTNFNLRFNRRTSWSVPSDQTPDLLRHEQFHLNLGVLIANQANAAAGSMKPKALIAAFKHTLKAYTEQYDNDTKHGTNTAQQAAWEANIASGSLVFPAP